MTTTFPVDARSDINLAENTGDWTSTISVSAFSSAPAPIEGTNCMGIVVSNTTQDAYDTITAFNMSSGSLFVWMRPFGAMDTLVNGGVGIQVGDTTNREAYHVGGSDVAGFRHESGPHEWTCYILDLGNKPVNTSNLAGSEASLDEANITQVGVYFETIVKSVGGGVNCYWDAIRFATPGQAVTMQGGTTAGAAGNGEEASIIDRSTGTNQAFGVIRELAAGVYGIQGNLIIGNAASNTAQFWEETNVTYAWEDRGLASNNYYRFSLIGRTGQTSSIIFNASTFSVPPTAGGSFDANGADLDVVTMNACTFIGFDNGIQTSDDTGDNWTGCTYIANNEIVFNGCDMSGSNFSEYVGIADGGVLTYDLNVDPDGELNNCTFAKTSGTAHHAIDFGANIPTGSITLRGCAFGTDFSASENTSPTAEVGDETFAFRDTTGTLTVNLIGCTGNFGFYSAGVDVTIVADPVTTAITVLDELGAPLLGARVILETSDGTGPLPFEDVVTITSSGTTATASHTSHGIPDGTKVVIRGANESEYNGVFVITDTGVNSYTYTMSGDPVDTATGTITASGVQLEGTTDSSGLISDQRTIASSQPLKGFARSATSSPIYKSFPLTILVDNVTGANANLMLIRDD